MSTIRTIINRSPSLAQGRMGHANGIGPLNGVDALQAAGVVKLHQLNYGALVNTTRFGTTSLEYLAIALRDEVLRLQAIVDAVYAALDAQPKKD